MGNISSAELVYRESLVLPGEFLGQSSYNWSPKQQALLADKVNDFRPVPTSRHGLPAVHVPPELATARYVFLHQDGHRSPLQRPYTGPFEVVESGDKSFLLHIGNKCDHVSIDRLKPAHLDLDSQITLYQPPARGRPAKPSATKPVPSNTASEQTQELSKTPAQRTRSDRKTKCRDRYIAGSWEE